MIYANGNGSEQSCVYVLISVKLKRVERKLENHKKEKKKRHNPKKPFQKITSQNLMQKYYKAKQKPDDFHRALYKLKIIQRRLSLLLFLQQFLQQFLQLLP